MTQNHPKKAPRSLQDARSPENHPHTHENHSQSLTEPHRSPSVMHPVNLTIGSPAGFMNANHRHHWSRKGRDTKAWRTAAWAHARSENLAPRDRRARVIVVFHHADRRRRDVGNLAPTAKAIVDGLTDAGLWPDDSDAYVVGPDLRTGEPWPRPGVEVFIEDAKEEAA